VVNIDINKLPCYNIPMKSGNSYRTNRRSVESEPRSRATKLIATGAALSLAVAGVVGYKKLAETDTVEGGMPKDVATLIQSGAGGEAQDITRLIGKDYRVKEDDNLSFTGSRVRIAEIGRETYQDYKILSDYYAQLDTFLRKKPENFNLKINKYGQNDIHAGQLDVEFKITPEGKDIEVLAVSAEEEIGRLPDQSPIITTNTLHSDVMSIIRPEAPLHLAFEQACFGMVNIELANPGELEGEDRDQLIQVGKTALCTAIALASDARFNQVPYDEYLAAATNFNGIISGIPGVGGYHMGPPFVGEANYRTFDYGIPANVGRSLGQGDEPVFVSDSPTII
jgi:hypothetical protein